MIVNQVGKETYTLLINGLADWFKNNGSWMREFVVYEEDEIVIIEKPMLDYRGKTTKLVKPSKNTYRLYLNSEWEVEQGEWKLIHQDDYMLKFKKKYDY